MRPICPGSCTEQAQYSIPPRLTWAGARPQYPKPYWAIWQLCRSDNNEIMHPNSSSVKQRSQPTERQRFNKLLDRVGDAVHLKQESRGSIRYVFDGVYVNAMMAGAHVLEDITVHEIWPVAEDGASWFDALPGARQAHLPVQKGAMSLSVGNCSTGRCESRGRPESRIAEIAWTLAPAFAKTYLGGDGSTWSSDKGSRRR